MAPAPVGILLAAGRGSRFDASGAADKLLAPLPDGRPVAVASAQALLAATGKVLAVIRPGRAPLREALVRAGCEVIECPDAASGMGHSLAHAIRASAPGQGWIVALADMPYVLPATIGALRTALADGAAVTAPRHGGRRGNPVAFAPSMREELLALTGDEGARKLVNTPATVLVEVDDPGIHMDIDTPSDIG